MTEKQPAEMPVHLIQAEAIKLSELRVMPWLSPQRKEEVSRRLNHLFFELNYLNGAYNNTNE